MSDSAFVHIGSVSEGETEDMVWRRCIFHHMRTALPTVLNLFGPVCMWAYQPSTEPEMLISSPAETASSPGEGEIHMHVGLIYNTQAQATTTGWT